MNIRSRFRQHKEIRSAIRDARTACRILAIAVEAARAASETISVEIRPASLESALDGPQGITRAASDLRRAITRIEREIKKNVTQNGCK
jgi:hypothetical protein